MTSMEFDFVAGSPAIDFVNTVSWESVGETHAEKLASFGDVVAWAEAASLIAPAEAKVLRRRASREPERAAKEHAAVLRLRDLLHDVFDPLADDKSPPAEVMDAFNRALGAALREMSIVREGGEGFAWRSECGSEDFRRISGLVLWEAAQLLTSERASRIGRCASDTCGWLFIDESRRGNRRWCVMNECGSRAKAKRYYEKKKKA
jgi:predicted RNA-binding Zn ribbon-like protein